MGKITDIFMSFTSGLWSKRLDGRVDLPEYHNACTELENFIVWPHGVVQNRPGSQFIRKVDNDGDNPSRLIPFSVAGQDDYIIDFGTDKNQVYKDKAYLLDVTVTSGVSGLYTGTQKWEFDYAQNKDTLYIASDDRTLNIIKRSSDSKFQMSAFKFEIPPLTPLISHSKMFVSAVLNLSATSGDWIKATGGSGMFLAGDVGRVITPSDSSGNKLAGKAIILAGDFDSSTGLGTNVLVKVLETFDSTSITQYEITGTPLAQIDPSAIGPVGTVISIPTSGTFEYIDELVHSTDYWAASGSGTNEYYLLNTSPYYTASKPGGILEKGVEMLEGSVGALNVGEWDWYDNDSLGYNTIYVRLSNRTTINADPDTLNHGEYELATKNTSAGAPPAFRVQTGANFKGDEHFIGGYLVVHSGLVKITSIHDKSTLRGEVVIELSAHTATYSYITYQNAFEAVLPMIGTNLTNAYPKTVTFHEDRLVLGGSNAFPQTIWMSDTGLYDTFTPGTSDSYSISLTLQSKKINVIKWMESRDILIVGTDNGEFSIGKRDSILTPSTVFARMQTSIGSDNDVKPVVGNKNILFVEKNAKKVRELTYAFESDDYSAADLTLLAEQVTGSGIKDMAFQRRPIPILWCTTDDGTLIGMTYEPEQNVIAWHEHKTGNTLAGVYDNSDSYESVAVIPGDNQDELWVSVKRIVGGQTQYYIEVFNDVYSSETLSTGRFLDSYAVDTSLSSTFSSLSHIPHPIGEYASKNVSISAEDTLPQGVALSSDGTKMYMIGTTADKVFQYTLSTAWDISTATYASKLKDVSAEDTGVTDLDFSSDGTKMYVLGAQNDKVYQYTLSSAWDVSTATYATKFKSVTTEDTVPYGLAFGSSGTKMYVLGGTNDTVYQYTLATAWDVSTATYDSKSKSVASEDTSAEGIILNSDGTEMYIAGNANDKIYQYILSTAWDVSTATYASINLSIASQEATVRGICLGDSDSKMYIVGAVQQKVFQYTTHDSQYATYIVDGDTDKVGTAIVNGSGQFTMSWTPTTNAVAGLAYTSTLKTMRLSANRPGTLGLLKRFVSAIVRLYQTAKGTIGPDDDNMESIPNATTIVTGDREIPLEGGFETDAYLQIQQDQPLPITISAMSIKAEINDKP